MMMMMMMMTGISVDVRRGGKEEEVNGSGSCGRCGTGEISQHTWFQGQARPWQRSAKNPPVFILTVFSLTREVVNTR